MGAAIVREGFLVGRQVVNMMDSKRCRCSSNNLSLLASSILIMSPKRNVTFENGFGRQN